MNLRVYTRRWRREAYDDEYLQTSFGSPGLAHVSYSDRGFFACI